MTCYLAVLHRLEQSISIMIPLSGSAKIAAWPGSHHLSVLYTTEADCSSAGDPDAKKMLEMLPEELRVDDGE